MLSMVALLTVDDFLIHSKALSVLYRQSFNVIPAGDLQAGIAEVIKLHNRVASLSPAEAWQETLVCAVLDLRMPPSAGAPVNEHAGVEIAEKIRELIWPQTPDGQPWQPSVAFWSVHFNKPRIAAKYPDTLKAMAAAERVSAKGIGRDESDTGVDNFIAEAQAFYMRKSRNGAKQP